MNNLSQPNRIFPKLNGDEFKKQLKEIRDAVTWLLDTIEVPNGENQNINISNPIRNNRIY